MNVYIALLPNSRHIHLSRYGKSGPGPEGTVLVVAFELDGREFMALNGGPHVTFNHGHSMVVKCETQDEIDRLWAGLLEGGGSEVQCGWLRDRYGLSWQIVPEALEEMMTAGDAEAADRMMAALMDIVKLDIAALRTAYEGR